MFLIPRIALQLQEANKIHKNIKTEGHIVLQKLQLSNFSSVATHSPIEGLRCSSLLGLWAQAPHTNSKQWAEQP